jgi:hypothetical protein
MNLPPAQCSDDLECVRGVTELVFAASQARGTAAVTLLSHRAAVLAIAAELQRPASEIAEVYCAELNHLSRRASVVDYLPVLTAKRVLAQFRARLGTPPPLQPNSPA